MSNGWPTTRRPGRVSQILMVPMMALALAGCAQDQKRGGLFGPNMPKPFAPKAAANRPEPGLRVRAPGVDVQMADREAAGARLGTQLGIADRSAGVSPEIQLGAADRPAGAVPDVQIGRVASPGSAQQGAPRVEFSRSPSPSRSLGPLGPID